MKEPEWAPEGGHPGMPENARRLCASRFPEQAGEAVLEAGVKPLVLMRRDLAGMVIVLEPDKRLARDPGGHFEIARVVLVKNGELLVSFHADAAVFQQLAPMAACALVIPASPRKEGKIVPCRKCCRARKALCERPLTGLEREIRLSPETQ